MISTKGRYAMRVMADLAEHIGETVPLSDIAKRQEISLKYLEAIVSVIAIKFLISYVRRHDFSLFGYYRIALGVIVIAYFLIAG